MIEVMVTGGAGFIGSHLARALLDRGDRVRIIDNLSTGTPANIAGFRDRVNFIEKDLRDLEATRRAMEGVEVVFHQAAIPSVPKSIENPVACHENGATATLNVLEAARLAGVRRVVIASSSSVYGDSGLPENDETLPLRPLSPYGATKAAGELIAAAYWRSLGLATVSLRYSNVYGPRQNLRSQYAAAIPKFISCALTGKPLPVYGDGEQSRDFTFVTDVVRGNLLAAAAPAEAAAGGVFNLATGRKTTVNDLVATLGEIFGRTLPVEYLPRRPGDILHSRANIDRARKALGYEPQTPLTEGLRETVSYFAAS